MAPGFVGLFPVTKVVNPMAVRLRLHRPLRIYPTFHVLKVKPALLSQFVSFLFPIPALPTLLLLITADLLLPLTLYKLSQFQCLVARLSAFTQKTLQPEGLTDLLPVYRPAFSARPLIL